MFCFFKSDVIIAKQYVLAAQAFVANSGFRKFSLSSSYAFLINIMWWQKFLNYIIILINVYVSVRSAVVFTLNLKFSKCFNTTQLWFVVAWCCFSFFIQKCLWLGLKCLCVVIVCHHFVRSTMRWKYCVIL